jgi:kynurenine formamidase
MAERKQTKAPKKAAKKAARRNRNPQLTRSDLRKAAQRLKNWGKWGKNDEVGTLNYVGPEQIIAAARLVMSGEVFSLALPFDQRGPQADISPGYPPLGRFNPIHLMLRTGADAYAGLLDHRGIRTSDDIVILATQCGTQWDGLSHVFYEDKMWNGYDCRNVSSFGAKKCGIEKTRDRMVGRGVLLDIPRMLGKPRLPDGFAITNRLLDRAEKHFGTSVGRGDFLLVRTGQMDEKLAAGRWSGYAGGDAPGLAFETLDWLHQREVAAVATDSWGAEVRPNNSGDIVSPFHWISIPIMGLTLGEMFCLGELAEACARDGRYDFLFVAPALPLTGAVASPINPLAIR